MGQRQGNHGGGGGLVGRSGGRSAVGPRGGGRHSGLPKLCNICFYTGADPNLMQLIKRVGDLDTATKIEIATQGETDGENVRF